MLHNIATRIKILIKRVWLFITGNSAKSPALPPIPFNESQRQQVVDEYGLSSPGEVEQYNAIVQQAAFVCETPIALLSICDRGRQFFKSQIGLQATEAPRRWAFCAHAVLEPYSLFQIEDAMLDSRFAQNPLVTGEPKIRFYAGIPLISSEGYPLGTLCVIDQQPRKLSESQELQLKLLAQEMVVAIELQKQSQSRSL